MVLLAAPQTGGTPSRRKGSWGPRGSMAHGEARQTATSVALWCVPREMLVQATSAANAEDIFQAWRTFPNRSRGAGRIG